MRRALVGSTKRWSVICIIRSKTYIFFLLFFRQLHEIFFSVFCFVPLKNIDTFFSLLGNVVRQRIFVLFDFFALPKKRYTIFCEASGEVLKMMQETCQEYYQASSSYNTLLRKAETEEPEIDAIRKVLFVLYLNDDVDFSA